MLLGMLILIFGQPHGEITEKKQKSIIPYTHKDLTSFQYV